MDKKIVKYNEKQLVKMNKIIDKTKNYKIIFDKINNLLCVYLDNTLILTGEYIFYGIYQKNTKLWIWGSSIPGVPTNQIKNINKIKKNDHLFEKSEKSKDIFYYQLLTQDVLIINESESILLNWINELLLYLSNALFYFNPINSQNNIQFLYLINIREKYF